MSDSVYDPKARIEELEKSVAMLQATLEATADGILVVDATGKTVNLNHRFQTMWHIPDEIVAFRDDARALDFVLEQLIDPDAFLKKVKELYANPDAESFDTLNFKDARIYERYSKPLMVGTSYIGRVWSFRDVTQQRMDEAKFKEHQEELEKINNSMINRELRMVELKQENEELRKKLHISS